ncbi:peroxidase superfamily protein [Actinidia rufa]|uniref:Peroxidase n=1 Tax=Actinidia rufa TaxID=165716 RepID=A0A7J0ECT9_9ERIC|nr:peroxidase superfamily protein [Actinidia rufa]
MVTVFTPCFDTGTRTIGLSHCTSFSNRLYNFSSTNSQGPSLNADYVTKLKQQGPRGPGSYFGDVLASRGLFTSDQALTTSQQTTDPSRSSTTNVLAWKANFVPSMIKMSQMRCSLLEAQLQVGFYTSSCPLAEFIVKYEVSKGFLSDRGVAAGLVRMHFHDCFVRGCDASVLIASTPSSTAEKDSPANNPSLRGRRLGYDVPAGRKDGKVSLSSEASANLPAPTFNVNQLTQAFANKGLTQEEMVTLSGAHTIGRSHCTSFTTRLYNFNATTNQDPSLDPLYASQLRQQCPQGSTIPNLVVPMNPGSSATMDSGYYMDVVANRGLFTSDQILLTNQDTADQVNQNAMNVFLWRRKLAAAMMKMGQIGVITDDTGRFDQIVGRSTEGREAYG